MAEFYLKTTGFVLNMTVFVLDVTACLLNKDIGFLGLGIWDFLLSPTQPDLLVKHC